MTDQYYLNAMEEGDPHKNIRKYYILAVLIFLMVFTIVIPVFYHLFTGDTAGNILQRVKKKYHPDLYRSQIGKRTFFSPWYE